MNKIPLCQLAQYEITYKDKFDALLAHYTNLGVSDFMIILRRAIKVKLHGQNTLITDFSITETQVMQLAEMIYGGKGL